jgi:pimeloyl-ACP methyl ester carboxylesterase
MELGYLAPLLRSRNIELIPWHEPSKLRSSKVSDYSFAQWMESLLIAIRREAAQSRVGLIGHSFGCIGAIRAAAELPDHVSEIVLLAPALDQFATHTRIAEIAVHDFSDSAPETAEKIRALLSQSKACSDESMRLAVHLASQDPRLLTHYWYNPEAMTHSLTHIDSPEKQVDMDSFFAVSEDYTSNYISTLGSFRPKQPTRVLFFGEDQVTHETAERQILGRLLPQATIDRELGLGHFGHLDDPERVSAWISKL